MAKSLSVDQLLNSKKRTMKFEGEWLSAFGCPERKGSWLIWGPSGSGKTTFAVRLCKYLTQYGRVAYNSLEQGDSQSLKRVFAQEEMAEVSGKIIILDRESMPELSERLSKPHSPDIVLIDSYQYTGMTYKQYLEFKAKHRNKLIIFVSHAEGKDPAGRSAKSVKYDCDIKIRVEGYVANVISRFGGNMQQLIIWDEGYRRYWGIPDQKNEEQEL